LALVSNIAQGERYMRMRLLGVAALFSAFGAVPASAASIDCRNQVATDLRMICDDRQLSTRDDQAAALFNQLMNRTNQTGQAALRSQRLGFMRERGACRANRQCMLAAYDEQISTLRSMLTGSAPAMRTNRPNW
jgi:uncharacterized protein